jgi:hypothetical protein
MGAGAGLLPVDGRAVARLLALHGTVGNQGLAKCTGFEDAVNLMIAQVALVTGMPAFTVQEIRDGWGAIPGELDRVDELATGLRTRAAPAEEPEPDAGGPLAAAAPPEP